MEKFISICKSERIGYDYYGLFKSDVPKVAANPSYIAPGYWTNLAIFREVSIKHGIPFSVATLSTSYSNRRIPSAADLAFQANTILSYGASGIEYFTYITPIFERYSSGPIDTKGEKTKVWHELKKVNERTHILTPLLVSLKSIGVYHFPADMPGLQTPPDSSLNKQPQCKHTRY